MTKIEKQMGFRSSYNFVPERYKVSSVLRDYLVENGFEVGVHGSSLCRLQGRTHSVDLTMGAPSPIEILGLTIQPFAQIMVRRGTDPPERPQSEFARCPRCASVRAQRHARGSARWHHAARHEPVTRTPA